MKMITPIILFVASAWLFGCNDADIYNDPEISELMLSCNVKDPIKDLEWLKEIVDAIETDPGGYYAVKLVEFESKIYIVVEDGWSSSPASSIYNCQGEQVLKSLNVTYNHFIDNAKVVKTLYTKN